MAPSAHEKSPTTDSWASTPPTAQLLPRSGLVQPLILATRRDNVAVMGENPNPPQPTSDPSQASPPVQPEGAPEKRYFCDSPTPDRDLPAKFAEAVNRLEGALGLPVWLLVQDGGGRSDWDYISESVRGTFLKARNLGLPRGQKVALLLHSAGGLA